MPPTRFPLVILLTLAAAAAQAQDADIKGGTDHPLISRYTGASILGYKETAFDEFDLPVGLTDTPAAGKQPLKVEHLQGKHTRILYVAPAQRSTLEVFTNYQQAIARAGLRTLFSCGGTTTPCGRSGTLSGALYPLEQQLKQSGRHSEYAFSLPRDERYIAAAGSNAYVSVYIARGGNSGVERVYDRAVILLDVIEPTTMDTGRVTVDAAAMAKGLSTEGHVALYEIYFDTGSATLKPESDTALREITSLLRTDPQLRLFVVGHTDNVGAFATNLDLSRRRAAAVVAALTTTHGIAATRLQAEGVGMLAPIASNETDAGRAKNRRVELVRR